MASRELALLQEIRDIVNTMRAENNNLHARILYLEQKLEGLKTRSEATWSRLTDLHMTLTVKQGLLQRILERLRQWFPG